MKSMWMVWVFILQREGETTALPTNVCNTPDVFPRSLADKIAQQNTGNENDYIAWVDYHQSFGPRRQMKILDYCYTVFCSYRNDAREYRRTFLPC
jgi:hypothetical protein